MVLAHNINEGDRTQDIRINQDVTFETMLLTSRTMQGLKDSGFYKPSPIQLHGIPLGKCGFDLLLEAKSGTGKTAVFSIIALEKIDINKGLQVVILAPTREIAMQICDVIKQIGARHKGLCVEVVMGGLPLIDDVNKFKNNVHIVVGSPGRLKHLIQSKYIDTAAVRLLILDEADKLMEKSFQSDISLINLKLPKQKQIIMSSATYPEGCKSLISTYVQNAQHICPDSNNFLLGIEQKITVVKYNSNIIRQTQYRFTELLKILTNKQFKQCLIFCNYQVRVSELYKMLTKEKWPVEQLYGQQDQTDRLDALKTLQEYKCRLLISTDLAARGIDASNVDLVINFEPPFDWQTYLHRIGRAGRFGSYGLAVTVLSEGREQNEFKILLESIKLPFHLTDLWSNAEFCINHHNVSNSCLSPRYEFYELNNESMSTFHKNNMDIWNALTSNFNLVEGFHKISETSIETETHDKLESFHDLLESFKDNNANCTSSKMPPKRANEHFPKDLTLQSTKFAETDNCNSIVIVEQMQNDKKTEDLNETNVNFCKTGIQHSKSNLDKGDQILDIENSMNANGTYSPPFPIDPTELSNEDLDLQTTKLTETDNCDNKVIIKEIQNDYKTENIYKINDNSSKTKIEYSKMNFDNKGKYQVLDMEHYMKSLNCTREQNMFKNNSNEKKDVNSIESEICRNGYLEISNDMSTEDDYAPKNDVNTESKMCETLAKLDLPTAFSSSRYMKSHNNYDDFSKQAHFKRNKRDDQMNPLNSKERHLKGNIVTSSKRNDRYNYKLDKFHHKNDSISHDHGNSNEDLPDKSKNRWKGSQYYRNHCNSPKDQQRAEKCNQTYMQWYSSLKLQVKQVELIMYFNEIRKIDL